MATGDRVSWFDQLERLRGLPPGLLVTGFLTLQFVIGFLDHYAGKGASFFVFYALPIAGVTWMVCSRCGYWLALFSGAIWLTANYGNLDLNTMWSVGWIALGRVAYFTVVAAGTGALRNKTESDQIKIKMLNEMRQLEMELVNAKEREQQRIGQDLHDGLCQQLAALSCALEALAADLRERKAPEADDARNIGKELQRSIGEARSLAGGMTSLSVARGGIVNALQLLVEMTNRLGNVPVKLEVDDQVSIKDAEQATHLYRIAQEAISNAVRHSHGNEVLVALQRTADGQVELRVEDDGRGFLETETPTMVDGLGLQTMRFRAHAIGASITIRPRKDGGTKMVCLAPYRHDP